MRYEILGETLPVVICHLESGEKMVTEGGGMSWMSPNMKMETTSNGGIGKIFGRAFSGEKMFQNVYTAQGGEGVFNTILTGPGEVWLQTMPISNVAGVLSPYFPSSSK